MTGQVKVWDQDAIVRLLNTNAKAVARALWQLYQRQTTTEQVQQSTIEHNGRGFNGRDAEFLSDIAKRLPHYDFSLTPRQVDAVRPKLRKYWRQLLEVIEANGGVVDYKRAKKKGDLADPVSPAQKQPSPTGRAVEDRPQQWAMF